MKKWWTTMLLATAVACPVAAVPALAQEAAPAPAAQPANNAADDADAAVREQIEAERAAAQQERVVRGQVELRAADRQRMLAAVEAARAEAGAAAEAQLRVALAARGQTEKAAWLGVSTSKMPRALRQHVKASNKYVGLVVERVEPESPAADAGLQQFDIVEKVNDQWIVNTEQFAAVLRMQDPGAEVTLSLIREGAPMEVKVTLEEKELPVLGAAEFQFFEAPAGGLLQVAPQGAAAFAIPEMKWDHLMEFPEFQAKGTSTVVITDNQHTLKVTTRNGKKTLEASDPAGVVIFSGPINTEEELAEVPPEVAEKLEKFDDLHGAIKPPKPPAAPEPPAVPNDARD